MSDRPKGYTYTVSVEQLRAFAALSYEQRFAWLESTRTFLVAGATPETIERIRRLRRGESIVGEVSAAQDAPASRPPMAQEPSEGDGPPGAAEGGTG